MKFALKRNVAALGMVSIMLLSLLAVGAGMGAAEIEDGYAAHEETVETDGPATVTVDLEAVNDSALDSDPLEVTTNVVDNSSGDQVGTQTVNLTSQETATVSIDVDLHGSYDTEVLVATESDASYLNSTQVTVAENRASSYEVTSETDLEVTNDSTDAYVDLSTDDQLSGNLTVTLEVTDNATGEVVRYDNIQMAANETGSIEVPVDDLDAESVDLAVYVDSGTDADSLTVDDIGVLEESGGAFPALDETVSVPFGVIALLALVALAAGYQRR